MASISEALQNFARLPYRLYIPSSFCQTPIKKWHANGVGHVFVTKIYSNLGVLQWAMLLLLCSCLQQLTALQLFHLILLSNLLYSTLVCVVVPVIVLMNWTTLVQGQLQSKAKHNYLLDIILFPSVFIIKLFLYLLERLYKTCFQFKATSKYSFELLCAISLESSIKGFSFHCYGYMPFTVLQHLV